MQRNCAGKGIHLTAADQGIATTENLERLKEPFHGIDFRVLFSAPETSLRRNVHDAGKLPVREDDQGAVTTIFLQGIEVSEVKMTLAQEAVVNCRSSLPIPAMLSGGR